MQFCDACMWCALCYVVLCQAAVAFNATYALVDDPKSYTIADVVITLVLSENRPVFGTSVYTTNVYEKCLAGTVLQNLNILVTSNNTVSNDRSLFKDIVLYCFCALLRVSTVMSS